MAMFELLPMKMSLDTCAEACAACKDEMQVRLLSWNILAPCYCNGHFFKDVHPEALRWSRRAAQIRAMLFSMCPEVICLQEVELHRPLEELGLCLASSSPLKALKMLLK